MKERKLPNRYYRLGCRWCNASFVLPEERQQHEEAKHGFLGNPQPIADTLERVTELVRGNV